MIWNKPSGKQLENYQKGCRIQTLFATDGTGTVDSELFYKAPTLTIDHLANESSLTEMVKAEEKYAAERNELERERFESERELKKLLEDVYNSQNSTNFKLYNSYVMLEQNELKIKLKKMDCPTEYAAQYSLIEVDKAKWMNICSKSVGQSESST